MRQVLFDNSDSVIEYFQKKDQDTKIINNQKQINEDKKIIKKQKKNLEQSFQEKNKQTYKLKKIEKDSNHSNFQTVGIDLTQKLDEQIESTDLQRDSIINQNQQTDRQSIDKQSKSSLNSNLLKSIKSNITKSIKDVLATKLKNQKKISKVINKNQSIYSKQQFENDYKDIYLNNNSILTSENSQYKGEINQDNSFRAQSKVQTENDSKNNLIVKSNRTSIISLQKQKSSEKSKKKSQSSNKKSNIVIEKALTVNSIKVIKENTSETQSNITSKGKYLKVNNQFKKSIKSKKDKTISIGKKYSELKEIQIDSVSENNQLIEKIQNAKSSNDSDSILPEYKVNAKKLTKGELESIKKYHLENFSKFHVEISSDEEQILKQDTD